MTKGVKYNLRCPSCKVDLICPKCGQPVLHGTPFSHWLRQLPRPLDSSRFSNHNLDYIWHNYRDDWLITIEEKQASGKCTLSQKDTHRVVSQLLQLASDILARHKGKIKLKLGLSGRRQGLVEYRGHYVIIFANSTPENSEWIRINDQRFQDDFVKDAIIHLLETGELP